VNAYGIFARHHLPPLHIHVAVDAEENTSGGARMSPRTLQRTLKSAHTILTNGDRTLATAESCTGGMIGAAITSMAGSSQYYRGGVIAYDNAVKRRVLGVAPRILSKHGAVSGPTVLAMARGARKLLGTDCAIAVSGIAGPGGGSPAKPV